MVLLVVVVACSVQLVGRGGAVISYVRVVQAYDEASGRHSSAAYEETRVWSWRDGRLVCVHFHRSPAAANSSG